MMNANILVAPLNTPPTSDIDISELSQCHFIHLINCELNKHRFFQVPPKVKYEVSEDRKEYVAYQEIPGYGSHFCYVFSGHPIVKTEQESRTPILDETIQLEEKSHPLIQKYVKEIRSCLPVARTPVKFKYHELTESFDGMKMPSVDPEQDVEQEYELVNTDGEIGAQNSLIASDLDGTGDQYDQFAQDPAHHDRPRVALKETILEKEKEQRVLFEKRLKNRGIVRPEPSSSDPTPKFKRTVSTRIKEVHLQPVSLGGNRVALVGHIPKESAKINSTLKDAPFIPSARQDLIQAMYDLEQELHNSKSSSTDSSTISPTIQQKIDKVWDNPLMRNLNPMQQVSLPPPPKINFNSTLIDKYQSN